eukprot:scaffold10814_cov112-Isochrysis_galbana.AAC.1
MSVSPLVGVGNAASCVGIAHGVPLSEDMTWSLTMCSIALGGTSACTSPNASRSRPEMPAAGSAWPTLALAELSASTSALLRPRRARAVSLHSVHVLTAYRRVGDRRTEEALLRLAVGCGEGGRFAILPHAAAGHREARRHRALGGAKHHRAGCLAARVAVGALVKGVTVTKGREHARSCKGDANRRQQHQRHTEHEAGRRLVELQGTQGAVVGRERRRASRIIRDARALQTEHE